MGNGMTLPESVWIHQKINFYLWRIIFPLDLKNWKVPGLQSGVAPYLGRHIVVFICLVYYTYKKTLDWFRCLVHVLNQKSMILLWKMGVKGSSSSENSPQLDLVTNFVSFESMYNITSIILICYPHLHFLNFEFVITLCHTAIVALHRRWFLYFHCSPSFSSISSFSLTTFGFSHLLSFAWIH